MILQKERKFASTVDVSAVATGSQMMQSITGAITGLAMGVTILIGQYIGEKKLDQAGKAIGSSIVLFVMIAIVATIIFAGFSGFFASALKAPEEAYESTVHYLQICASGIIFIIAFNALGSIFRGIGDSILLLFPKRNCPSIFLSLSSGVKCWHPFFQMTGK